MLYVPGSSYVGHKQTNFVLLSVMLLLFRICGGQSNGFSVLSYLFMLAKTDRHDFCKHGKALKNHQNRYKSDEPAVLFSSDESSEIW